MKMCRRLSLGIDPELQDIRPGVVANDVEVASCRADAFGIHLGVTAGPLLCAIGPATILPPAR